jgi:hypothetical protein
MNIRMAVATGLTILALAGVGCANYATPRHDAPFGAVPTNYFREVTVHLQTHEHYPPDARFKIGNPRKAYMNNGLFLGGDIIWVGYIVDVHVQSVSRGFRRSDEYVVRLRNDSVVEAHRANDAPVIHEM